jgi:hypothetical protein
VAIYTEEVGGERELYRHFLKDVGGGIVEVLGEEMGERFSGQMALEKLLGGTASELTSGVTSGATSEASIVK